MPRSRGSPGCLNRQAARSKTLTTWHGSSPRWLQSIRLPNDRNSSNRVRGNITKEQRGYIYQLVIRWADARVRRDPRLSVGAARAASWGILKRKYNLSKYEDLPIGKYAECVAYIKQACYESTGVELDLPEQK